MTERSSPVPRATYRLQLTQDFTFADAAALAPYLGRLGISHAYLSPILKARPGSTHGYDVVDHTMVNPELGTLGDFRAMAARFKAHGLGIILDIVPNHMGIGGAENPCWLDVLEWGRASRFAEWFDINWAPSEPSLREKVLVPFLGSSYAEALENRRLDVRFDARAGEFAIWAEDTHRLPVTPSSYPMILQGIEQLAGIASQFESADPESAGALKRELAELAAEGPIAAALARLNDPAGREALDALIQRQHWRAARYSVAADDINYRRFFIVSDLAAIRIEREDVFDHVHRLVFQLVAEGLVEGLRVDHIDGLFDPKAYCRKLREKCPRPIYLVVEKILAPHEQLRADWQVDGTTGYEFASEVTRLLVDPAGEAAMTAAYESFAGPSEPFDATELSAKLEIIDFEMAAELDALTVRLHRLATGSRRTADLTRNGIRNGLRQVIAAMRVYRTYIDGGELADGDRRNIAVAIADARRAAPAVDAAVFDFLNEVMTGELCRTRKEYPQDEAVEAAQRIQQFSGPVMAKGLEDTALYRHNRLITLNDVGERPDRFSTSVASFHDFNRARLTRAPLGMLTSSSHDTKRGEDTRARIAVLSGIPAEWTAAVSEWDGRLKAAGAPEIAANDAYYFYQLLLGAWPASFPQTGQLEPEALGAFRERVQAAMLKSLREARLRTNWTTPCSRYEDQVSRFIDVALAAEGPNRFLEAFRAFEGQVGLPGAQNGLIQTTLKLTSPGVPDIYQGAEFWEQSMVDPDNRRPVDFRVRADALCEDRPSYQELYADWRDGRLKQRLIADLLNFRKQHPDLFSRGSYEPVEVAGARGNAICAFLRRHEDTALLVVARLHPTRAAAWGRLQADVPAALASRRWRPIIGDERGEGGLAELSDLLMQLPVAVLVTVDE